MYFSLFPNYLPFEKGGAPSFEQNWFPFTQGCFVPSLVEIGSVVLEKKIFDFVNVFSLFRYYLPLKKGVVINFNKIEYTITEDVLSQVWLKFTKAYWAHFRREKNYIFCELTRNFRESTRNFRE